MEPGSLPAPWPGAGGGAGFARACRSRGDCMVLHPRSSSFIFCLGRRGRAASPRLPVLLQPAVRSWGSSVLN